jgi:hypothetical protein
VLKADSDGGPIGRNLRREVEGPVEPVTEPFEYLGHRVPFVHFREVFGRKFTCLSTDRLLASPHGLRDGVGEPGEPHGYVSDSFLPVRVGEFLLDRIASQKLTYERDVFFDPIKWSLSYDVGDFDATRRADGFTGGAPDAVLLACCDRGVLIVEIEDFRGTDVVTQRAGPTT